MAESSWPTEAPATVTEHDYERLHASMYADGIVGDVGLTPAVFADSTGLQVKIRAGTLVRVRGFMWYSGDTDVILAITSNTSGQSRQDRVVLRLDRSDWTVTAAIIQGTPGGGPPALTTDTGDTGEYEHVIGEVFVPTGTTTTITASMIQARNQVLGPQLLLADADNLAPGPNLPQVFLRWREDNQSLAVQTNFGATAGRRYLYLDTGWVNLSGTSGSGWSSNSSASTPHRIRRRDSWVSFRVGNFDRTGGTVSAGTAVRLPGTIPSEFRPAMDVIVMCLHGNTTPARVVIYNANHSSRANQIWVISHPGLATGNTLLGSVVSWPLEG